MAAGNSRKHHTQQDHHDYDHDHDHDHDHDAHQHNYLVEKKWKGKHIEKKWGGKHEEERINREEQDRIEQLLEVQKRRQKQEFKEILKKQEEKQKELEKQVAQMQKMLQEHQQKSSAPSAPSVASVPSAFPSLAFGQQPMLPVSAANIGGMAYPAGHVALAAPSLTAPPLAASSLAAPSLATTSTLAAVQKKGAEIDKLWKDLQATQELYEANKREVQAQQERVATLCKIKVIYTISFFLWGQMCQDGSTLDYRSTGHTIDPAPGACFTPKFILLAQVCPQPSIALQCRIVA